LITFILAYYDNISSVLLCVIIVNHCGGNSHWEGGGSPKLKNLEWQCGRNGGCYWIGCPMNGKLEDKPFPIGAMVIDLIAETEQNLNVDIILDGKVASV
jgi:hypothetical protein